MEEKIIKVHSISDIITNSSTEVFMMYTEESLEDVKNLVNAILKLNGNDKTFDDYFEIKFLIDDDFKNDYLEEHPDATDEEIYRDAIGTAEYDYDNESPYPPIDGIEVIAKCKEAEECAKLLSGIGDIFETYASYC